MPLSLAAKAAAAVIAVGSVGAYEFSSPDVRGQTAFLERLALKVDHARAIAPQTAVQLSALLARSRARPSRDGELDARRQQAIARIESALKQKSSVGAGPEAQSSPVARR